MGGTDQVIVTTKVASSDLEKMSKKCLYLHWMAVAHAKQGEGHGTTIMSDCLDRKLPGQSLILTTAGKDSVSAILYSPKFTRSIKAVALRRE